MTTSDILRSKVLVARPLSALLAVAFKAVGLCFVVLTFLDIIVLAFPVDLLAPQWQLNIMTQFVDRAILPLMGLTFLLTGNWIDSLANLDSIRRLKFWQDWRFWIFSFSSLIALALILVTPLYLSNLHTSYTTAVTAINDEKQQAEEQIALRAHTDAGQVEVQYQQLLDNPEQLEVAIAENQISQEDGEKLRAVQQKPAEERTQAYNEFLVQKIEEFSEDYSTEVDTQYQQAISRVTITSVTSATKITVKSIFLAAAYLVIGWLGIKQWLTRVPVESPTPSNY